MKDLPLSKGIPPVLRPDGPITAQDLIGFLWTLRGQSPHVQGFFKALHCASVFEPEVREVAVIPMPEPFDEGEEECVSS